MACQRREIVIKYYVCTLKWYNWYITNAKLTNISLAGWLYIYWGAVR